MNSHRVKKGFLALAMIPALVSLPVAAQLPILNEKEWLGYFTGFESKKVRWSFSSEGKSVLRVIGSKGDMASEKLSISLDFVVEEVMPDGKIAVRALIPESLESAQAPTTKPKGLVVRGKARGDVGFELYLDENGGNLSLGGRVTDPGPTVKNPLRFGIRMKLPDAYPDDSSVDDKKKLKAFETKIKNDRLQFIRVDKSRGKQSLTESVEVDATAINGGGIVNAEIEMAGYKERKFLLAATESSIMNVVIPKPGPLYEGFVVTWNTDPAKDPQGKARFSIEVR
jgi:hypothetical protein